MRKVRVSGAEYRYGLSATKVRNATEPTITGARTAEALAARARRAAHHAPAHIGNSAIVRPFSFVAPATPEAIAPNSTSHTMRRVSDRVGALNNIANTPHEETNTMVTASSKGDSPIARRSVSST